MACCDIFYRHQKNCSCCNLNISLGHTAILLICWWTVQSYCKPIDLCKRKVKHCPQVFYLWLSFLLNFFKGETRTPDWTHVIRNLPGTPPIISVWCLPYNTGNPNQNYEVHIAKLHTNYRNQMNTTLPLVVGVIFAPQLYYFNSMSVCFTVWVIARLGLFPCALTLNYNHGLTPEKSQAFLWDTFCFIFLFR